jgi:diphosphomevalonate decarboxylase
MTLSSDFKDKLSEKVQSCWMSPSNIALVKYWGKKEYQIPANPSLSFTLSEAYTITRISAELNKKGNGPEVSFIFEGEANHHFGTKVELFLKDLSPYLEYLPFVSLTIESGNNFPHSAGIASSASGMSALALSLVCIEQQLLINKLEDDEFFRKASFIARIGSGSACRSIYSGFSIWGEHPEFENSSDKYAVPIVFKPGNLFESIRDTILIVNHKPKKVSSRAGHQLMTGHPYAKARYDQAFSNLVKLKRSMIDNDWDSFVTVVENEALSLHAMMMTSNPGFVLMDPDTLKIIELIGFFRKEHKMKICFTLDAGPNVHLLYPAEEQEKVDSILDELKKYCFQGKFISDYMGTGPVNKHCK